MGPCFPVVSIIFSLAFSVDSPAYFVWRLIDDRLKTIVWMLIGSTYYPVQCACPQKTPQRFGLSSVHQTPSWSRRRKLPRPWDYALRRWSLASSPRSEEAEVGPEGAIWWPEGTPCLQLSCGLVGSGIYKSEDDSSKGTVLLSRHHLHFENVVEFRSSSVFTNTKNEN